MVDLKPNSDSSAAESIEISDDGQVDTEESIGSGNIVQNNRPQLFVRFKAGRR